MVREYARQQESRAGQILAKKAEENAEREAIFQKLAVEQERTRAEAEYIETLRFQLYQEETEEQARMKEQADIEKRNRIQRELMEAKLYQERLKEERKEEELRMEGEFKQRLLQKYSEDDRTEQMNA
jgi:hypothetical protein